jgi:hypothetical protein
MRNQWRILWCLTGLASFFGVGGCALGQASYEVPQYPQYVQYPQGAPPVTPAVPGAQVLLSADQIDQLLAPIALYPDPLLSLIFPAATFPQDVGAAEQWLQATPNPTEADIAAQNWDASIKGLVHYPTVLKMMSDQMEWTQTLGAAFVNQQQDVLASVQRLRARAQAARNLQTTQQEQIVSDGGAIRIEPVDPNLIYVPQYDPNLVYTTGYQVSFGVGYPIGLWCDNDFDWNRHFVVTGGGWYQGWHHPEEWDRHPPAWDRHPATWVAAPTPWVRAAQRPAPRVTPTAVAHLGLDRPRGPAGATPAAAPVRRLPAPLPVGKEPAPAPSRNVFDSSTSREQVQRSLQRARPVVTTPTPPRAPSVPVRPAPAPAAPPRTQAPAAAPPRTPTPAAPPRAPAPAAPVNTPAPAARSAPSSAFSGGSASETRAQSARGNASVHNGK